MANYDQPGPINVGTGEDLTIRTIAELIRDVVHPDATLVFDDSKPDGMRRKVLDVSRIHALGWHHAIDLTAGIRSTYDWYLAADRIRGQHHSSGSAA
jgi:GDP-L-fucose synthase